MKKGERAVLEENEVAQYVRQAVNDYFTDLTEKRRLVRFTTW